MSTGSLLAVDLGLRSGLAVFCREGRLRQYRSTNFGTVARLKKATGTILRESGPLEYVVVEGGGQLLRPWIREAERVGARVLTTDALTWRRDLLLSREQRTGADAKRTAQKLALDVIAWSGAPAPTSVLRDDVAEAILIGVWAVKRVGWLDQYPQF